jgi:Cof subfamily protein (haloacid dehalogenase superfamily)
MIKHIFCDLDGTLLYHTVKDQNSPVVVEENIKAIQRLQKHGIIFSIATGRSDGDIKLIENHIQSKGYRISDNGAAIYNKDDCNIYNLNFSLDQQIKVLEETVKNNLTVFVGDLKTNKGYFSKNTTEKYRLELVKYLNLAWEPVIDSSIEENINNPDLKVNHVCIILDPKKEDAKHICEQIEKRIGDEFNIFWSSSTSIDITLKGADKSIAIQKVMKLENLKSSQIAVIGDGENDIKMFGLTSNSFVMSHARDNVKNKAKYETGSVAEAINKIIMKNEG